MKDLNSASSISFLPFGREENGRKDKLIGNGRPNWMKDFHQMISSSFLLFSFNLKLNHLEMHPSLTVGAAFSYSAQIATEGFAYTGELN